MSEQEFIAYYTSMSIEEFEAMIRKAYANDIKAQKKEDLSTFKELNNNVDGTPGIYSVSTTQRLYYDSRHYLSVNAVIQTVGGFDIYTSISGYGHSGNQGQYPYYSPNKFNYTLINNRRQIRCQYSCVKYLAPNISDAMTHTVTATFTANGGDLWGGTEI